MAKVKIAAVVSLLLVVGAVAYKSAAGLPTLSFHECAPNKTTPVGDDGAANLCFVSPLDSVCLGGQDVNMWTRCYPIGGPGATSNEAFIDGKFWCTAREPTTLFCLAR